jgi:hypothetical protein
MWIFATHHNSAQFQRNSALKMGAPEKTGVDSFTGKRTLHQLAWKWNVWTVCIAAFWGRLFKASLALTIGLNLTCCFSLCISARLFISNFKEENSYWFLKNYFQIYKQAVGKFGSLLWILGLAKVKLIIGFRTRHVTVKLIRSSRVSINLVIYMIFRKALL